MIPRKIRYDSFRLAGVRGLAAGVLKQALDTAVMGLKSGIITESADFIFNPDREEDRAIWLGLANLDEGEFQSLCMKVVRRATA